jgi:hypothetical protein
MGDGDVQFVVEALGKNLEVLNQVDSSLAKAEKSTSKFSQTAETGNKTLTNFAGGMKSAVLGMVGLTSAAAVGAAAIKFVTDTIKLGVTEAAAWQLANVQLEASIKSMGRESEISAGKIDIAVGALEKISVFDDTQLVQGYNTLLKFGNIGADSLDKVMKVAVNMTQVGGNVADTADSIGRALETGVIPRSWGFSAALKANFSDMVKAGDSGKALAMVLDELNRRYGGQAEAQLETYTGQTIKLKNAWADMNKAKAAEFVSSQQVSSARKWYINSLQDETDLITLQTRARAAGLDLTVSETGVMTIFNENLQQGNHLRITGNTIDEERLNLLKQVQVAEAMTADTAGYTNQSQIIGADQLNASLDKQVGYVSDMNGVYLDLVKTLGQTDDRTIAVGMAFGILDQTQIDMIVHLHNFDVAMQEWGNKPITKQIVIQMWSQEMGGWSGGGSWNGGNAVTGQTTASDYVASQANTPKVIGYDPTNHSAIYSTVQSQSDINAAWKAYWNNGSKGQKPSGVYTGATGGDMANAAGRPVIVGEGPTGWSNTAEVIIGNHVIPHAQADQMKRAGMLDGAHRLDGGGFWAGGHWVPVSSGSSVPTAVAVSKPGSGGIPVPSAVPMSAPPSSSSGNGSKESSSPGSSSSGQVTSVSQAIQTAVQSVAQAQESTASSTTAVTKAAEQISQSGKQTTQATQQGTQKAANDAAALLYEIRGLRRELVARDASLVGKLAKVLRQ